MSLATAIKQLKDRLGIETEAPGPEPDNLGYNFPVTAEEPEDVVDAVPDRELFGEEKTPSLDIDEDTDLFDLAGAYAPIDVPLVLEEEVTIILFLDEDEEPDQIVLDSPTNLQEAFFNAARAAERLTQLLLPPDPPKTYCGGPQRYYPHYPSIIMRDAFPEKDFDRILWIAQQDRLWVDAWGHLHDIDKMPLDYKLNILSLLHEWIGSGVLPLNPYDVPLIQRLRADLLSF